MRVLIVAPSLDILGGQSVQALRLKDKLEGVPGLDVGFLPINPRLPGPLRFLQSIKYVRTLVTSLLYVATLLARVRRYDVIHIFSASYFSFVIAPTPAIVVSKLYGRKIVLNYHSGEAEDHLARWRRTAIPTLRLADRIIVPSEYLVRIFGRAGLSGSAIANHLEIDHALYRERCPLRPVFLSNRNLEPHYNVGCVLRAFAAVQARYPDARLVVAGDGSQRGELMRLASSLGLRGVEFTGRVRPDEMPRLIDEADIFLNGSDVDNMPLSILEAFASGLPVVTTDAGGIPFIVTDGETGLMVARGDSEALGRAAMRLLDDEDLAARIASRARLECAKYSWGAVGLEWIQLYEDLAGTRMTNDAREYREPGPYSPAGNGAPGKREVIG